MSNDHINKNIKPFLLASMGILERIDEKKVLNPPKIGKKIPMVTRIAWLFIRAKNRAITHGIPNWQIAKAAGTSFSGTHRIHDIRRRFKLENPDRWDINPIEFNRKYGTYHIHDVDVFEWLKKSYG
jgi:hypothetical protein